jgi:hypothetical protein
MEQIREIIIYRDKTIQICMKSLTPIEQYELIRLATAFPHKQLRICTHENTSTYIDDILKQMKNICFFQCFCSELLDSTTGST